MIISFKFLKNGIFFIDYSEKNHHTTFSYCSKNEIFSLILAHFLGSVKLRSYFKGSIEVRFFGFMNNMKLTGSTMTRYWASS